MHSSLDEDVHYTDASALTMPIICSYEGRAAVCASPPLRGAPCLPICAPFRGREIEEGTPSSPPAVLCLAAFSCTLTCCIHSDFDSYQK